jgi:hypothetical protein
VYCKVSMQRDEVRQRWRWIAAASWQRVYVEPSELCESQLLEVALPISRHATPYIAYEQILAMQKKVGRCVNVCREPTSSLSPSRKIVGHDAVASEDTVPREKKMRKKGFVCEHQRCGLNEFDMSRV